MCENWRANHLQFNNGIHVRIPIRYGRTSGNGEKKVHTMVFSALLQVEGHWGTAYAVPFKLDINNFTELYDQAKYLSYAEGANDTKIVKGADKWCVIWILINPCFDAASKQLLLNQYQQQLDAEDLGNVYPLFCIPPEPSILSRQGDIVIPWPTASNPKKQIAFDQLDFIIATCPRQNLPAYPDTVTIKTAVLRDGRVYFFNNVASGITTYQDREIMEL